nr:hypothetical protein [Brucella intermedia]
MPSKELIASVIEAIVKNPPKVTRFKDMETLEYSEAIDYTPTAQAVTATIFAALLEPTENMLHEVEGMLVSGPYLGMLDAADIWERLLAAALGEQAE